MAKKYYKSKIDLTTTVPLLPGEQWKAVEGYDNLFLVSNLGRLKRKANEYIKSNGRVSRQPERLVKVHYRKIKGRGYGCVTLSYNGQTKHCTIHSLVAKTFIPNPEHKPEVNHIDGNKHNNTVANLEWCTRAENMYHAKTTGLIFVPKSKNHSRSVAVDALDIDTNEWLATFGSANIAAIFCTGKNSNASHILECCKGIRSYAYGYQWQYHTEETVTTNESHNDK